MHRSRNSVLTPFLYCTPRLRVCGRVNHKGCLCSLMFFYDAQRQFNLRSYFHSWPLLKISGIMGYVFAFCTRGLTAARFQEILGISFA